MKTRFHLHQFKIHSLVSIRVSKIFQNVNHDTEYKSLFQNFFSELTKHKQIRSIKTEVSKTIEISAYQTKKWILIHYNFCLWFFSPFLKETKTRIYGKYVRDFKRISHQLLKKPNLTKNFLNIYWNSFVDSMT